MSRAVPHPVDPRSPRSKARAAARRRRACGWLSCGMVVTSGALVALAAPLASALARRWAPYPDTLTPVLFLALLVTYLSTSVVLTARRPPRRPRLRAGGERRRGGPVSPGPVPASAPTR